MTIEIIFDKKYNEKEIKIMIKSEEMGKRIIEAIDLNKGGMVVKNYLNEPVYVILLGEDEEAWDTTVNSLKKQKN